MHAPYKTSLLSFIIIFYYYYYYYCYYYYYIIIILLQNVSRAGCVEHLNGSQLSFNLYYVVIVVDTAQVFI